MKRLFLLLVVCLFSIPNLFAFNGYTHKELTRIAINEYAVFPNAEINDMLKRMILNGCGADRDLNDNNFYDMISHPFNISSFGANNIDEEYENCRALNPRNVLFYMFQNYTEAIHYWKNIHDYDTAMEHLGSAIRYIQDICCAANQLEFKDDYYNNYIDEQVRTNRTNLLNLLKVAMKNRKPLCGDTRVIAMNYFDSSFKFFKFDRNNGYFQSDLSFAFEATCCLINSFCQECGINVQWR